jgi:hypothetical protein
MAKATALARARRVRTRRNAKPKTQPIGPHGPKHPGNRQLCDKRGRPDAGARLCGNRAHPKVATFYAALWLTFTLPLTEFIELSLDFLAKPWNIYENGSLLLKQTVLRLAFTEPLRYSRESGYRTIETAFPFKVLAGFNSQNSEMVRAVGLEPTRAYAPQILSLVCLPFQHARIWRCLQFPASGLYRT